MRNARLHLALSDNELAIMKAHADELGASLSSLGHEWVLEVAEKGTDLSKPPVRENRVQILVNSADLAAATRRAKESGLELHDILRHNIAQLQQ